MSHVDWRADNDSRSSQAVGPFEFCSGGSHMAPSKFKESGVCPQSTQMMRVYSLLSPNKEAINAFIDQRKYILFYIYCVLALLWEPSFERNAEPQELAHTFCISASKLMCIIRGTCCHAAQHLLRREIQAIKLPSLKDNKIYAHINKPILPLNSARL